MTSCRDCDRPLERCACGEAFASAPSLEGRVWRCPACDRAGPTRADREALERTLRELRALDRETLAQVSLQLMTRPGLLHSEPAILLARIAYVLAHEGLRG